jgi:hypothetical protein
MKDDECYYRIKQCARRILTAVCFRESSASAYELTGTAILPPIGFYYSLFHMSVAMLLLDPKTGIRDLKNIGHRKLENLIENRLILTRLIHKEYYDLFNDLKKVREYANYVFNGTMKGEIYIINIKEKTSKMYLETGKEFKTALNHIFQVGKEIDNINGNFSHIPGIIGDDIGNDVLPMYLSDQDKERVVQFLISQNLTT